MDAFAKADDERDFYLDLVEGFIIFVNLDKHFEELALLERELAENSARYCQIPKMTFYETKKFMEGFVNEKVYDIDTKEKLLNIIGSKEARENFLEFIYDHLTELEKWQQYYYERARIHIIEWLRDLNLSFVFEEDLDISGSVLEQVKHHFFEVKVSKEVQHARNIIKTKAKTYYSNEALNPRPRRGRPPKQVTKVEAEPQYTNDIYKAVPPAVRSYLFTTDYTSSSVTFSAKYTEAQIFATLRGSARGKITHQLEAISQRLEALYQGITDRSPLDMDGIETENKECLQEVSSQSAPSSEHEKKKISGIAKELLPKERMRFPRKKEDIQKFLKKKRKAGIKQVIQIKRLMKTGKKKEE